MNLTSIVTVSLRKLKKRAIYRLKRRLHRLNLVKPKIREPKDKWLKEAQAFEFDFHKNNAFRQSDEFILETKQLFRSFGFHPNDFINKTILDLGAGSRMRGKFFSGAFQIIIEPMAERCMKEIPWCDFKDAGQVFSLPAEETIPDLKGKVDFLFSINVLDHCHDFESIVANIYLYLKPGGKAFLSFDSHFEISLGHPLILTESICSKIFKQQGFKIDKITEGFHREYAKSSGKPGYDNSSNCLSYWLSKT